MRCKITTIYLDTGHLMYGGPFTCVLMDMDYVIHQTSAS